MQYRQSENYLSPGVNLLGQQELGLHRRLSLKKDSLVSQSFASKSVHLLLFSQLGDHRQAAFDVGNLRDNDKHWKWASTLNLCFQLSSPGGKTALHEFVLLVNLGETEDQASFFR